MAGEEDDSGVGCASTVAGKTCMAHSGVMSSMQTFGQGIGRIEAACTQIAKHMAERDLMSAETTAELKAQREALGGIRDTLDRLIKEGSSHLKEIGELSAKTTDIEARISKLEKLQEASAETRKNLTLGLFTRILAGVTVGLVLYLLFSISAELRGKSSEHVSVHTTPGQPAIGPSRKLPAQEE